MAWLKLVAEGGSPMISWPKKLVPGALVVIFNCAFRLRSDYAQKMLKRIPQRRYGELSDLDGPLLLLASDSSAYMTGAIIAVDGGHLASVL
ncbi:MAG TPA: SDR family oxidoreductase [Caulobacteraceae bacterium]|nr:SDR family oxidoreductase [Caulobacteraceae bacterium]